MKIDTAATLTTILAAWYFIKRWYNTISKVIEPLVLEVEKMAVDGIIDKDERKKLVMKAIAILETEKKIRLNFLSRFLISKVVDFIAKKLPDFKISQETKELLTRAKFPV